MSRTYLRTFRLSFERPKPGSDVVIRAEVHHITEAEDGTVQFISGTQHELFRLLSAVQSDPVTYTDSQGVEHVCAIADIAGAVIEAVKTWFPQDIPEGEFDPDGLYVVSRED